MGKIISLVNEKGGVGKTTMTFNLAYYLSAIEDKKVLVVDLDPQFNLTRKFWSPNDIPEEIKRKVGTSNALTLFDEPEEFYGKAYLVNERVSIFGTSAHISTCNNCPNDQVIAFRDNLNRLSNEYDYVLIDCPPSVGNLQFAALSAARFALIPTVTDIDSTEAVVKVLNSMAKVKGVTNPNLMLLGIFFNVLKNPPTVIQKHFVQNLEEQHKGLMFQTKIMSTTQVQEASTIKQSLFEYAPQKAKDINLNAFMVEALERIQELEK
ncbi:ParA family protein [Vibrio anguillarum]|nr:ParA family protein [Vibrio anguillarum]AGU59983.1 hypothetical protein N175_19485 [Vibrio anguillarum M3]MBT2910477.1 ParA family protein [Vibrio anguillarum]MBT2916160.1 ParA family protein [Vibrio anguillarum]MBT2927562.1 ParA family protein [Vibrio anguillarum]MBT2933455.1 ParA family protein [Vibrio anguillarum]